MDNQQWSPDVTNQPTEERLKYSDAQMGMPPQPEWNPQMNPDMNGYPIPPVGNPGPWMGPPPMTNMMPPYSPDFAILRDKGRSPLFLTSAILLLLLTIGQIVYSLSSFAILDESLINEVSGTLGTMIDMEYVQMSMAAAVFMNLLVMCPQILIAIGMFVLAVKIRGMEMPSPKGTGLGAVKAGVIIQIVCLSFILVIVALILIFGIIAGSIGGAEGQLVDIVLIFFGMAILFSVVLVPVLVYDIQLLNICSRVQDVLCTGNVIRKPLSMYVIVMNYVTIAVNLLSLITDYYDWIGIILTVVGCIISLLLTIVLQQTRSAMEHWRMRQYR